MKMNVPDKKGKRMKGIYVPYFNLVIISFRFPIRRVAQVTYYQEQADTIDTM